MIRRNRQKLYRASIEQLEHELSGIDSGCGYNRWFRVLAAIKYETKASREGFALADRWRQARKADENVNPERSGSILGSAHLGVPQSAFESPTGTAADEIREVIDQTESPRTSDFEIMANPPAA